MLGNELTELTGACGDRARRDRGGRLAGEDDRVLVHDHVGARSGRHDDRALGRIENADGVAGGGGGFVVKPGVVRGLAAAGLRERDLDLEPEPLEDADGRHPDRGVDFVDQAGVEKLDSHAPHIIYDPQAMKTSRRALFRGLAPVKRGAAPLPRPAAAPLRESDDSLLRINRQIMACRVEIVLPGEFSEQLDIAREALDEADRLEEVMTIFRETSELTRVNRAAARGARRRITGPLRRGCPGGRTQRRHRRAHSTSRPRHSVECWGFLRREGRLPPADAIDAARARVGMHLVELDGRRERSASGAPASRSISVRSARASRWTAWASFSGAGECTMR